MNQKNNQEGDEEDLKKDDGASGEDGQSQNGDGDDDNKDDDEVVTIKKSELEKIKSDKENYRQATLKKKAEERKLGKQEDGEGDDEKKDDAPKATLDVETVKGIVKEAFQENNSQTEKENQVEAQMELIKLHPEYADDAAYSSLMQDFSGKRGKKSVKVIMQDLEDAILLNKHRTGKLDEFLNSERERGRQEGRVEGQISSAMGAGNVGDRGNAIKSSEKLSPEGEKIARSMGVDPKKAAKIDIRKDNVITQI